MRPEGEGAQAVRDNGNAGRVLNLAVGWRWVFGRERGHPRALRKVVEELDRLSERNLTS